MNILLVILFSFIQGDSSPSKWNCVADTQPPNTQVARLKPREINKRVLSCKTPVLPVNVDATGAVIIEVLVNETGDVACLRAISGESIIRGAALDAAKKWKFKPLVVNEAAKPYSGFIVVYVSWDVDSMEKHCPNRKDGPNKSLDASPDTSGCFVT
jgi:hypothetical protein